MVYEEQLEYCRSHSRSDGYIHCDNCVFHCNIAGCGCPLASDSCTLEYCDFFICDGCVPIENATHFAE